MSDEVASKRSDGIEDMPCKVFCVMQDSRMDMDNMSQIRHEKSYLAFSV